MSLIPGAVSVCTSPSESHHCSAARRWAPVEAAGDLVSEAEVVRTIGGGDIDRAAVRYIEVY